MANFLGTEKEMEIWAEKYRPETLDDYVGNDHIKDKVERYIEENDVPHLLFYSKKPGTGKCLDWSEEVDIKIDLSEEEKETLSEYIISD